MIWTRWRRSFVVAIAVQSCNVIASDETEKIAAYIGTTERIRYTVDSAVAGLRQSHPQVASALNQSLGYMDSNEVHARAAAVLDRYVTAQEAQNLLAFMTTSLGQRFSTTLRTALSPEALNNAISKYPKKEANDPMFSSPAMAHMLTAMDSPEWRQTWKDYGDVLMCRHIEKDNPQGYANLRKQGRCIVAKLSVPADSPRPAGLARR